MRQSISVRSLIADKNNLFPVRVAFVTHVYHLFVLPPICYQIVLAYAIIRRRSVRGISYMTSSLYWLLFTEHYLG
ncbi:hypothetical protein Q4601_07885 [Shewanella sp. 1_MG-2023]|uniref:hypothetical protein n=1 Tax=unclassified Shewanella TaxID=196818 RepID=UPI0026E414EB|nr:MULTISPECIES: hypothetical protein [unclassified Shewanella]MDO6612045.1 hypothetical protein [Shewanella sp. 7_MG-2023]MDO6771879.1 hypothetical protein [Shewanella sp. 2_MG-2023]MDO6794223.1 hypothetical protein [Shewanella sp. 1_MG-2023]